jgi:NAD(P)-dependent dehydrogenase (short-subunit alcohol dehydrogenase family)
MKTILITGSTDGIGKLAAIKLAKDGHQIFVHGRNSEKLRKTVSEIKELSHNENIEGFVSDLSDFSSIQKMIAELTGAHSKIDVLINNAGVFKSAKEITKDGLDIRFAVNYLAPMLLTENLKPLLQKSDSPRIINLSSAAQSPVSIPALLGKEKPGAQAAYAQSKLALTMWSFQLAKNWDFATVIAVNPGSLLNTRMVKEAFGHHWSPATKGSDILYDLALSKKYVKSSGSYFDNDQGNFNRAHEDAYNEAKIRTLMAETHSILSIK